MYTYVGLSKTSERVNLRSPFAICEFDPEPINPCQQQCWDDLSHWLIGRRATRWHAAFAGAASGARGGAVLLPVLALQL